MKHRCSDTRQKTRSIRPLGSLPTSPFSFDAVNARECQPRNTGRTKHTPRWSPSRHPHPLIDTPEVETATIQVKRQPHTVLAGYYDTARHGRDCHGYRASMSDKGRYHSVHFDLCRLVTSARPIDPLCTCALNQSIIIQIVTQTQAPR